MKAELEPAVGAMIYAHAHATGTDAGRLSISSRLIVRDRFDAQ
jgi:hypothetical protein